MEYWLCFLVKIRFSKNKMLSAITNSMVVYDADVSAGFILIDEWKKLDYVGFVV